MAVYTNVMAEYGYTHEEIEEFRRTLCHVRNLTKTIVETLDEITVIERRYELSSAIALLRNSYLYREVDLAKRMIELFLASVETEFNPALYVTFMAAHVWNQL